MLPALSSLNISRRRPTSSSADILRSDVTSTDPFIPPSSQFQKKTNSRLLAKSSATSNWLKESQVVPSPTITISSAQILRRLSTRTFSWEKFQRTWCQSNSKNISLSLEKLNHSSCLSTQTTPPEAMASCASKIQQLLLKPLREIMMLSLIKSSSTSQETSVISEESTTTSTQRISH